MNNTGSRIAIVTAILLVVPTFAVGQGLPTREGTCVRTKIAVLSHRLQNGVNGPFDPDSGSAVQFTNGGYQVAYEELDAVHHSRVGDPVFMCLVVIPRDCPAGDARGRVYTTTNLRTMEPWTMQDSEHSCGGA